MFASSIPNLACKHFTCTFPNATATHLSPLSLNQHFQLARFPSTRLALNPFRAVSTVSTRPFRPLGLAASYNMSEYTKEQPGCAERAHIALTGSEPDGETEKTRNTKIEGNDRDGRVDVANSNQLGPTANELNNMTHETLETSAHEAGNRIALRLSPLFKHVLNGDIPDLAVGASKSCTQTEVSIYGPTSVTSTSQSDRITAVDGIEEVGLAALFDESHHTSCSLQTLFHPAHFASSTCLRNSRTTSSIWDTLKTTISRLSPNMSGRRTTSTRTRKVASRASAAL